MTPKIKIYCPKCGSSVVEKLKNQECQCITCGKIFYFVTPNSGSAYDLERYKL
jgi:uncharacterized Zn finger protein